MGSLIIVSLSLIIVTIFLNQVDEMNVVNKQWLAPPTDHLALTHRVLPPVEIEEGSESEYIGSVGLGLWSGEEAFSALESDAVLRLETPQDLLTAYVENVSFERQNMILKVFYNYEETAFRVVGAEDYRTEFLFTLDPFEAVEIPFHLAADLAPSETFSQLTIGAFFAPERFSALTTPEESNFLLLNSRDHGRVLNFEMNDSDEDEELMLPISPTAPLRQIEDLMFTGLMINLDFDPPAHAAYFPPNPLQVRSGEQVELGFVAGPPDILGTIEHSPDHFEEYLYEVEEYLIIVMVNWQQVMVNGEPYIRIDETGGFGTGQHGRFFIDAPTEAGLYEVVAFLVHDPAHRSQHRHFFPLEIAPRFTLEVVDEH